MGEKLLTEGLQKILETFDDEDCPHEQYYRGILNEVIQGLDTGSHSELNGVLSDALKAICLTRDYVGANTLPALDGWEWYEAGKAIAKALPNDEWTKQFVLSTGYCPQYQSETGIKIPRGMAAYCEDCGWPDGDFGEED